jgi:hypothetical protein
MLAALNNENDGGGAAATACLCLGGKRFNIANGRTTPISNGIITVNIMSAPVRGLTMA